MPILFILFLMFTLLPAMELYILIHLSQKMGGLLVVAIIISTGVIGAALAKQQGIQALKKIQESMGNFQIPAEEVLSGFLILAAGIFLVTPGFMTDAFGFSLLIPPFRLLISKGLMKIFKSRVKVQGFSNPTATPSQKPSPQQREFPDDDVIDV